MAEEEIPESVPEDVAPVPIVEEPSDLSTGVESRIAELERKLADIEQQLATIASRLVPVDTPHRDPEESPRPGNFWFKPIRS